MRSRQLRRVVAGRSPGSFFFGAAGLLIGVVLAIVPIAEAAWNPTVMLGFGERSELQNAFAVSQLGEVITRPEEGHDGKYFFIQALDPLYLEPGRTAVYLDRPRYRAQRMLYPLIAGLGGILSPYVTAWMLVVVSVIAFGVGSWATAEIARDHGGSPWLGLAFALNLGLVSELYIGGAGVLALALAVVGVLAIRRGRGGLGIAAMTGAVLSRGALLLFAAGVAALLWRRGRRRLAVGMTVGPAGAAAGWWWYLAERLGSLPSGPPVSPFDFVPFRGLVSAIPGWLANGVDGTFGVVLILVSMAFILRVVDKPTYLGWGAAGTLALAPLLSVDVWQRYFDISRAMAPVLTAYVVLVFLPTRSGDVHSQERESNMCSHSV